MSAKSAELRRYNMFPRSAAALGFAAILLTAHALAERASPGPFGSDGFASRDNFLVMEGLASFVALYLLARATRCDQQGGNYRTALDFIVGSGAAVLAVGLGLYGWAITAFASYLVISGRAGSRRRAAGMVIGAVAIQAHWAPLVYNYFKEPILRADTALAGSLAAITIPGATWSDTLIVTPYGHSIRVYGMCSSFHNVSLASLAWISLAKLERPHWNRYDIVVGAAAVSFQVACNVFRLYLVALSPALYVFWHEGLGKHFFSVTATVGAVFISVLGTAWAGQIAARKAAQRAESILPLLAHTA